VLEPWFFGARTGLSPPAVILSAFFWSWLWGGTGLLLSMPLTVCLFTVGKYVSPLNFLTVLLGSEPALEPRVRLYQRLLAEDREGAAVILEEEGKGKSLAELEDALLVPALGYVERDRHEGKLDPNQFREIARSVHELVDDWDEGRPAGPVAPPAHEGGVLCLPAADEADEVVASLLAGLLEQSGVRAEVVGTAKTTGEKVEFAAERRPDAILISALPPGRGIPTRYLHKRLRQRLPEVPIVIGLWGDSDDYERLKSRLSPDQRTHVTSSVAEAHTLVYELARGALALKP
jgi:CheY-like chemotaxis protein